MSAARAGWRWRAGVLLGGVIVWAVSLPVALSMSASGSVVAGEASPPPVVESSSRCGAILVAGAVPQDAAGDVQLDGVEVVSGADQVVLDSASRAVVDGQVEAVAGPRPIVWGSRDVAQQVSEAMERVERADVPSPVGSYDALDAWLLLDMDSVLDGRTSAGEVSWDLQRQRPVTESETRYPIVCQWSGSLLDRIHEGATAYALVRVEASESSSIADFPTLRQRWREGTQDLYRVRGHRSVLLLAGGGAVESLQGTPPGSSYRVGGAR